jgi:glycerol-3-phosphate acyltransferase PlsY
MSVPIIAGVTFAFRAAAGLGQWTYVAYGVLAEVVVVWALRPNIKRLVAGEERLVGWRARRNQSGEESTSQINGEDPGV